MLTAMLVASFNLFANDSNKKSESKKNETTLEKKVLIKKVGDTYFYLHCRIRRDSEGVRYYEFCRHETRIGGRVVVLRYADPSEYPSLN